VGKNPRYAPDMTIAVPHLLYALVLGLPPMTVLIALPMVFGWVRPNHWYGVRTRKTRSSRHLWYRANRLGGIYMIVATLVAFATWGALTFVPMRDALQLPIDLTVFAVCQVVAMINLLVKVHRM
jgi:uncharacterized membrane protein